MTLPGLADVLAAEALARPQWLVLHALSFGPMDALDLRDVLAPHDGPRDVAPLLHVLADRGWVSPAGERWQHTPAGAAADARLTTRWPGCAGGPPVERSGRPRGDALVGTGVSVVAARVA